MQVHDSDAALLRRSVHGVTYVLLNGCCVFSSGIHGQRGIATLSAPRLPCSVSPQLSARYRSASLTVLSLLAVSLHASRCTGFLERAGMQVLPARPFPQSAARPRIARCMAASRSSPDPSASTAAPKRRGRPRKQPQNGSVPQTDAVQVMTPSPPSALPSQPGWSGVRLVCSQPVGWLAVTGSGGGRHTEAVTLSADLADCGGAQAMARLPVGRQQASCLERSPSLSTPRSRRPSALSSHGLCAALFLADQGTASQPPSPRHCCLRTHFQ